MSLFPANSIAVLAVNEFGDVLGIIGKPRTSATPQEIVAKGLAQNKMAVAMLVIDPNGWEVLASADKDGGTVFDEPVPGSVEVVSEEEEEDLDRDDEIPF